MSFSVSLVLSGSAIGLEHSRHEDGVVRVALAKLLLSVLQVVVQPLMLGRMSGIDGFFIVIDGFACSCTFPSSGDCRQLRSIRSYLRPNRLGKRTST